MNFGAHIPLEPGAFVQVEGLDFGLGKLLYFDGEIAEVEYFDSIKLQHRLKVPEASLKRVKVMPQNRCYVKDDQGNWQVGRVVFDPDAGWGYYLVQFPNQRAQDVEESRMYVRWNQPVSDPMEVLIHEGYESPYNYFLRQPILNAVVDQRRAARGLNGFISSGIQLYQHQMEVVQRVAQDPVQRYLLADEVGLGKTIEAGVLIRQYLLDYPKGSVQILAPGPLLAQWEQELNAKFKLSDFVNKQLVFLDHHQMHQAKSAGMLVVDEAHHLAAMAHDPEKRSQYLAFARVAHHSPRLLLLSATPVRRNERSYLAMLHLLDPDAYPLDGLERFAKKTEARQVVGRVLSGLSPKYDPDYLLEALQGLYPIAHDDQELTAKLERLEADLRSLSHVYDDFQGENEQFYPQEVNKRMVELRVYLSEAYRIHRRLLRNRRNSQGSVAEAVKGRHLGGFLPFPTEAYAPLQNALEDWLRVLQKQDGNLAVYAALATRFVEAAHSHPHTLAELAQTRLQRPDPQFPLAAGEEVFLQAMNTVTAPAARAKEELLCRWLVAKGGKVVVFLSDHSAKAIGDKLYLELGKDRTVVHFHSQSAKRRQESLEQFRLEPHVRFLLADSSAEEGLNLQFAQTVLLFDLPADPNRTEQRIGRLDRIGASQSCEVWSFGDPKGEGLLAAWTSYFNSFGVFDHSISSLQFLVDRYQPLFEQAVQNGEFALRELGGTLAAETSKELDEITYEDLIDQIQTEEVSSILLKGDEISALQNQRLTIVDVKRLEGALATPLHKWLTDVLGFRNEQRPNGNGVERYFAAHDDGNGTVTRVPWERIRDTFSKYRDRLVTYKRSTAVANPQVHLLRLGDPFVDDLVAYLNWDDRGQNYGWWRYVEEMQPDSHRGYFRFDYIVEASLAPFVQLQDAAKSRGIELDLEVIRRWLDSFWIPSLEGFWLDTNGDEVVNPAIKEHLSPPYGNGRPPYFDRNLSSKRRWALEQVSDLQPWREVCEWVRLRAETSLRKSPGFISKQELSARSAQVLMDMAISQLEQRALLDKVGRGSQAELDFYRFVRPAVLEAVEKPVVRLDAVGFVVLSGTFLEE